VELLSEECSGVHLIGFSNCPAYYQAPFFASLNLSAISPRRVWDCSVEIGWMVIDGRADRSRSERRRIIASSNCLKTPKGMTQPPLPHPLQLLFYFVCRFSQSRSGRQSPRSPDHLVTFLSYADAFGNARANDSGPRG
jgi:hypothetical protein